MFTIGTHQTTYNGNKWLLFIPTLSVEKKIDPPLNFSFVGFIYP